ncbi:hypothetical protein OW491_00925 [Neptunomonas sp. CHC150]|uniref:hypothetical protein n=1 Tax=Neptunomonas sp. CHC150 TaxID=2998324 RepID=UPI0025AF5261|nr:hypothetical protein [Neptunomonas sp. CHC150]MDN2658357.1 hypothetical protein [Neptunomonas sp. CHC150]
MKYLVFSLILIASIGVTYRVTFDMTQEIVGALYIQGIINDHKVHQKLVEAIEADDSETVSKISNGFVSYNIDLLEALVSSRKVAITTALLRKKFLKVEAI